MDKTAEHVDRSTSFENTEGKAGEEKLTVEAKQTVEEKQTVEAIQTGKENPPDRAVEKNNENSSFPYPHIRENMQTVLGADEAQMLEKKKKKKIPEWYQGKQAILTDKFSHFFGAALIFGILYTFCMYKNPYGIMYPVMIGGGYAVIAVMLRMISIKIKRESWFLVAAAVLLGVSTCRTADMMLIWLNKLGEFLLLLIFVIHQFYDDRRWSIGKYLGTMAVFLCHCIGTIFYPFSQGKYFFKKINIQKYKAGVCVLVGLACAVPLVTVVCLLLGQADAVFGAIITHWIESFLNFWSMMAIFFMMAFGTFGIYCLISGACRENLGAVEKDVRVLEPIAAMTCMSAVAVLYVFFCVIQIYYLFMGKGSLPEGMTYSSYARQGFFQLLFVAIMNLVMVLVNLKYFKKNGFLNFILIVVCGCTYVMIASAFYRMALYVGEYHLTYLRVLVLWFLVVLAVMMAGVVVLIFKNEFPLFTYCLVTISLFFVGFSLLRPERVVAEYNVKHVDEWSEGDFIYMTEHLSADAAPALMKVLGQKEELVEDRENFYEQYYNRVIERGYDRIHKSFRSFNFSFEEAKKAVGDRVEK